MEARAGRRGGIEKVTLLVKPWVYYNLEILLYRKSQ